jgi:ABC-type spermidine/putrescine transport system permease subunit I
VEVAGRQHWRARRARRARERAVAKEQGVWYPKGFWPSFAAPGTIWIALFFVIPFYLVFAVAFGTNDLFGNPFPIYQPWFWSGEVFSETLSRVCCGPDSFYTPAYLRTFTYVAIASAMCLVIGYAVAYFVARYGGRRKVLFLVLLVAPFWISYLMRMYAWQSLLTEDGYVNELGTFLHILAAPVNWQEGKPITVILGLVYGYIPYMILPLYAGLDRIDSAMLEAGRDLGASPTKTFVRVTLPLSRQAILAGLVIVALPMFGDYYTNNMLSNSPKTTMIGNLIDNALGQARGGGEAASLVLTLIVILIIPLMYYLRSTKRAAEGA